MPRKRTPRRGRGAPPIEAGLANMRALAHPLRLRLIELFAEAPRTTKQVADLLGEPPTRLYHHVAALERAGLLRLTETRQNRGATEKWYTAAVRALAVASTRTPSSALPRDRAAKRALAMTVLEQARQELIAAMQRRGDEPALLSRFVVAAPAERIPALRKRLYEVAKEIKREFACEDADRPADEVERWALTMTFAPVAPRPRRSGASR
jgi:DNA-binding transcriptional ArsR family regulator